MSWWFFGEVCVEKQERDKHHGKWIFSGYQHNFAHGMPFFNELVGFYGLV